MFRNQSIPPWGHGSIPQKLKSWPPKSIWWPRFVVQKPGSLRVYCNTFYFVFAFSSSLFDSYISTRDTLIIPQYLSIVVTWVTCKGKYRIRTSYFQKLFWEVQHVLCKSIGRNRFISNFWLHENYWRLKKNH